METYMNNFHDDKHFSGILSGIGLIDHCGDAEVFGWMESVNDWKKLLNKIRFINPENNFDYTMYGDYFFVDNNLYILTERENYKIYDIKKNFQNTEFDHLLSQKKYLIEGVFAGFDTLRKDDFNESIYYGDILKIELKNFSKCKSCEFFGGPFKDKETNNIDIVYGPISFNKGWNHCSNPNEPYYIFDQAFGIIPNLCMAVKTEIVANVFYDMSIENNKKFSLDIINKATLPDMYVTCNFWDYFVSKEFREGKSNNEIWDFALKEYNIQEKVLVKKHLLAGSDNIKRQSWWKRLWF